MRTDRWDRRLKSWWRAAEDWKMRPLEDTVDVDTQPLPVTEGFLNFDAPDYRPVDVTPPRRSAESILAEIMAALEKERKGLH